MACRHTNVLFASQEQVNLYTTLDSKAKGVSHFRGKYEAVFMVVKYTLISILNLSLFNFQILRQCSNTYYAKYKNLLCIFKYSGNLSLNNFQILRQCTTKYETKIQEALLIKKHNPKLNAQPYGGGSSILLNVF